MHGESKAAELRQSLVPLTCTQNFENLYEMHAYKAPFCMYSCVTPLSSVSLHRRCSASALMSPRLCYSFIVPDESNDSGVLLAEFALNRICFAPQESSFRSISLLCTTVTSPSPWHPWSLRWLPSAGKKPCPVTSFHSPIAVWLWPQQMALTSSALPKGVLLITVCFSRDEIILHIADATVSSQV